MNRRLGELVLFVFASMSAVSRGADADLPGACADLPGACADRETPCDARDYTGPTYGRWHARIRGYSGIPSRTTPWWLCDCDIEGCGR
jgi:hypothetical protein